MDLLDKLDWWIPLGPLNPLWLRHVVNAKIRGKKVSSDNQLMGYTSLMLYAAVVYMTTVYLISGVGDSPPNSLQHSEPTPIESR